MTTYNFVPARNRKYGWVPDRPDPRDKLYSAIQPKIETPEFVDLRGRCSAVEDQGAIGSCSGNAVAGMLEFLENKNAGQAYTVKKLNPCEKFLCALGFKAEGCDGRIPFTGFKDVSRLFIYYNARALDGIQNADNGASLRSALKAVNSIGYCWEEVWPYTLSKVNVKPPDVAYQDAQLKKVLDYSSLLVRDEMLTCLADGYPFIIGISIFESFETSDVRRTGIVPMPSPREASRGGHAILIVGYDKKTERFLARNSWGSMWGMSGYFTIPFDYIAGYAWDAWTIRR